MQPLHKPAAQQHRLRDSMEASCLLVEEVDIENVAAHTDRLPTPVDRHGDGVEGVVVEEDTWVEESVVHLVFPFLRQLS